VSEEITIIGSTLTQKAGQVYPVAWRVYGTEEVYRFDDGLVCAVPNTWRLIKEIKFKRHARRFTWPGTQLAPTVEEGDGIKLYAGVIVDREGRERWFNENAFILPSELGPETSLYDVTVYNIESGVIGHG
jgi:hypothetical protein